MLIKAMIVVEHEVDIEDYSIEDPDEIDDWERSFNVEEFVAESLNRDGGFLLYESDIVHSEKEMS